MIQLSLFPDRIGRGERVDWLARLKAEQERRRVEAEHRRCEDDHCQHCRCEDCIAWERAWLAVLTGTAWAVLPSPPGSDSVGAAEEIAALEAMLDIGP